MPKLARWFFAAVGRDVPADGRAVAAVETALTRALDQASEEWPDVALERQAFVRHVAGCVKDTADPAAELARLALVDLVLAAACLQRVPGALAAFEALYRPPVVRGLRRQQSDGDLEQEIWQSLCTRLFVGGPANEEPGIATYRGRSPLRPFVIVCAQRLRLNRKRQDRVRHHLADRLAREPIADSRGPELSLVRERYREPFEAALRDALAELPGPERTMLKMRLVNHASTSRMGKLFRVSPATISRRLSAARDAVWAAVTARLTRELGLVTEDVESLTRALASQVDVAISTVFESKTARKSRAAR